LWLSSGRPLLQSPLWPQPWSHLAFRGRGKYSQPPPLLHTHTHTRTYTRSHTHTHIHTKIHFHTRPNTTFGL
jgi:hypothetical protein